MATPTSRVARVELFHVAIPLPATFRPAWIPGMPANENRFTPVRVTTDDGVEGYSAGPAIGRERSGARPAGDTVERTDAGSASSAGQPRCPGDGLSGGQAADREPGDDGSRHDRVRNTGCGRGRVDGRDVPVVALTHTLKKLPAVLRGGSNQPRLVTPWCDLSRRSPG